MNDKYPPLTTAALVPYSSLSPFSEVASAEKMAELEKKLEDVLFELQMARLKVAYREEDV